MVRAGATAPSQALIVRLRVQTDASPPPQGAATTLGGSNGQSLLGARTRRHKLLAIGAGHLAPQGLATLTKSYR